MQRNMLTELQLPKLDFKKQQTISPNNSFSTCYLLQGNKVRVCPTRPGLHITVTPPAVSDLAEKLQQDFKKQFALKKQLLVEKNFKYLKNDLYQLPKNSSNDSNSPAADKTESSKSCKTSEDATRNGSYSTGLTNISINSKKSNDANRANQCSVILFDEKSKKKTRVKINLKRNYYKSSSNSLLLPLKAKAFNQRNTSSVLIKNVKPAIEDVATDKNFAQEEESKPFCVISEVFGNADAAFSGAFDSEENVETFQPQIETSDKSNKDLSSSNVPQIIKNPFPNLAITEPDTSVADSDLIVNTENTVEEIIETEVVSSCGLHQDSDNEDTEDCIKNGDVLERQQIINSKENVADENENISLNSLIYDKSASVASNVDENVSEEPNIDHLSENSSDSKDASRSSEAQLITPKKTNDITKIKGWRRKQFLVEKPTTVEFFRLDKGSKQKKIKINQIHKEPVGKPEEPGNKENAFTCDSLDEFLDGEVDLKVNYEIPHLYAERGIKLTSEEIYSKPNFSENDFKEVEDRYRLLVPVKEEVILDEIDTTSFKVGKRPSEDDIKPFKFIKTEDSKKVPGKVLRKPLERSKVEVKKYSRNDGTRIKEMDMKKNEAALKRPDNNNFVYKLESKLLGLAVYPGPSQPLNPLVQMHLNKLRSYSTTIDKNWADFAASAISPSDSQYERKTLPVLCCVKVKKQRETPTSEGEKEIKSSAEEQCEDEKSEEVPRSEEKVKLKECCVVVNKINLVEALSPWCMEHHKYDCEPCGLQKTNFQNLKELSNCAQKSNSDEEQSDQSKEVSVLPKASFCVKIANLLVKKLRALKYSKDTLKSIDCLRTLVPDDIQFIKLNFIQESYHSSCIRVWYLKRLGPSSRSRAFLTFSETPPAPRAVNLKPDTFSDNSLPKIISDIVSPKKIFSPNEYAILHCNGEVWEIHGSLNMVFDKSDKITEQVFASMDFPEMEDLKKSTREILKVDAIKWWILDLTQEFQAMEIKFGKFISSLPKSKLLELADSESEGFIPLRKQTKGRVLGAFLMKNLLPFVFMGPYYLFETHNLTLKSENSTISFMYFSKEDVTQDTPLKYFVNSVIIDVEKNSKVLDGLWFYDKIDLDKTSYIEVLTRNFRTAVPKKFPNIDIEHGYSLNSLTKSLPPGVTAEVVKRKDGQEELKKIPVYLYFDVFELGFLEGELQRDNSIIIRHPLDQHTKVKSHRMGEWFVRTIKRRIEFIPKNLEVKWFVTKHVEDLGGRRPFNKFLLSGAHVLTKNGVFYLLELSDSKIEELGIKKTDFNQALTKNQVIKLVLEMKNLANLLMHDSDKVLSMQKLLTTAIKQIKVLETLRGSLKKERAELENERLKLTSTYLNTLNSCNIDEESKLKMLDNIEDFFIKDDGGLREDLIKVLIATKIGRKYFKRNRNYFRYYKLTEKVRDDRDGDTESNDKEETRE